MPSPTYQTTIYPEDEYIIMAVEASAPGTPGTGASPNFAIKDAVRSAKTTLTHQIHEVVEKFGYAQTLSDRVETVHEAQHSFTSYFHAGGIGPRTLFRILGSTAGGAADTVTGTGDPYTHVGTVGPTNNRLNTDTIWHDMGDGNPMLLAFSTMESWTMQWSPGSECAVSVSLRSFFPSTSTALYTNQGEVAYVAPPSGTNLKQVGKDFPVTALMGFQANYQLQGSSGAYSNKVLGGQIVLQRPVQVVYGTDPTQTYGSQARRNPIDIVTGPLSVHGVFDIEYDGIGTAGQIYRDYLQFASVGSSGSPQKVKFVDPDGHSIEFAFWPITYDMSDVTEGTPVTASMNWKAKTDRNTMQSGNGDSIMKATLLSPIAGALIL